MLGWLWDLLKDMRKVDTLGRAGLAVSALSDPQDSHSAVVKSDDTVLEGVRGLYIGTGGDVSGVLAGSATVCVYKNLPSGYVLPGRFVKVMAATTAADIVALY